MDMRVISRLVSSIIMVAAGIFMFTSGAQALTVDVVGHDRNPDESPAGTTAVTGYRWVLQEDKTYKVEPGVVPTGSQAPSLSGRFHVSNHPVLAEATSANLALLDATIAANPGKHFFLSVLPYAGYSMGGAQIAPGQTDVTINVNGGPQPTAQISVFVFQELQINGAPDLPEEPGLEGFDILLFEAAGQFGIAGGQVLEDFQGNPLGTTYKANGTVAVMGDGTIRTDPQGQALIKHLPPGKYGIQAVPPAGQGWIQTSTIEGTKTQDAWVKHNEPEFFTEFGPPGPHVFIGFVETVNGLYQDPARLTGSTVIEGQVVNLHNSRPPDPTFYNGEALPHSTCWVGLNDLGLVSRTHIYAARCNPADNSFAIPNVAPGEYQLVVWDDFLVSIIAFYNIVVNPDGSCSTATGNCNLQEVATFNWFSRLENSVFLDSDGDGIRRLGEIGMPEQNVNLRFRDGRIYQAFPTDLEGFVPFDEVFPFFSWLVAEIDFARFKATGVTYVVDAGGPIDPATTGFDQLNPQLQPDNGGAPNRTLASSIEGAPPLTLAFQGLLGQTSVMEWGKKAYDPGENGGISGMVFYAVTRAEDDPRNAAGEEWEPGIPRVQVNLYEDFDEDGMIDDQNAVAGVQTPDIDNYPLDNFPGPEDVNNTDGLLGYTVGFDMGDAIRVTHSDSWDDNQPTGCVNDEIFVMDGVPLDCYDNLRNFNQVREGVFDGGYAFGSVADLTDPLAAGMYIVEATTPPGYTLLKEEDRNVDFGDELKPIPALLPAACVGEPHLVPAYMSFQTDAGGSPLPGIPAGDLIAAPFTGTMRPLCDRKQVRLADRTNAAADFFLFTFTPPTSLGFGFALNDVANEFDAASPQFGEKYAPPNLPVALRDWTGKQVSRTHTDGYGRYNLLVHSTYSVNAPMPSGVSPNMMVLCMNDPGPIANPAYTPGGTEPETIIDPFFDPKFSQFCYTQMFMPGATTYLDTPVLPVAAFAGPDRDPVDCECAAETPAILSVNATSTPEGGPRVPSAGGVIEIASQGMVPVPNPAYTGPGGTAPKNIDRDYGFGTTPGTVTLGGVPLTVAPADWTDGLITATIPNNASTGQLMVTRGGVGGKTTKVGVTVTVGLKDTEVHVVDAGMGDTIQSVIDAADPGDLVLVPCGTYDEQVAMWKPVQLQGFGSGCTTINALNVPGEKRVALRAAIDWALTMAPINQRPDLLPGQEALFTEEGAGILVLGKDGGGNSFASKDARIDGFKVIGADNAGGIVVNGYGAELQISNNRISNNGGVFGGGIRSGHPTLTDETTQGLEHVDAENNFLEIHHNQITQNGNLSGLGSGGGIALYTGSDHYEVTENWICGNFASGPGGGISHLGYSDGGDVGNSPVPNLIAGNTVIFNQSFNQGQVMAGGGISVQGKAPLDLGAVGPGAGSVTIEGNLIQGNNTGSGDGAGIYVARFNGRDAETPSPNDWSRLEIVDNMIVNNVAGLAGGGISLQDAAVSAIHHNTIANNDSTATAGSAVDPTDPNQSLPQPAGVVSHAHSTELNAALTTAYPSGGPSVPVAFADYSKAVMSNNIIWQNRSFHFALDNTVDPPVYLLLPDVDVDPAVFDDLAVIGFAGGCLVPQSSILTNPTEDLPDCDYSGLADGNISGDPAFNGAYVNTARNSVIVNEPTTAIQIGGAADEGGTFIEAQYGPLTILGSDYHIGNASPAGGAGDGAVVVDRLTDDFDGEARPTTNPDIGADENPNAIPLP